VKRTLAPTSNDNAVPTRSLVPQSSYKDSQYFDLDPDLYFERPYLRPEILGHFTQYGPISFPLFLRSLIRLAQQVLLSRNLAFTLRLLDDFGFD